MKSFCLPALLVIPNVSTQTPQYIEDVSHGYSIRTRYPISYERHRIPEPPLPDHLITGPQDNHEQVCAFLSLSPSRLTPSRRLKATRAGGMVSSLITMTPRVHADSKRVLLHRSRL